MSLSAWHIFDSKVALSYLLTFFKILFLCKNFTRVQIVGLSILNVKFLILLICSIYNYYKIKLQQHWKENKATLHTASNDFLSCCV